MESRFIYLDWNVFRDLIKEKNKKLYGLIDYLKTDYYVPFSYAHLCDRQKNFEITNTNDIVSDLNILNNITDGFMLGRYKDAFSIETQDLFAKFEEVKQHKDTIFPNPEIPEEVVAKISKEGMKSFYKNRDNVDTFNPVMFKALNRFDCEPILYKALRNVLESKTTKKDFEYMKPLRKHSLSPEELVEITETFLQNNEEDLSLREKMRYAYMLLDINPHFKETVNEKNNFINMYTDSDHMINASFSKYYISIDKHTRMKTKMVYEGYHIGTKIFSVEEFIDFAEKNQFII